MIDNSISFKDHDIINWNDTNTETKRRKWFWNVINPPFLYLMCRLKVWRLQNPEYEDEFECITTFTSVLVWHSSATSNGRIYLVFNLDVANDVLNAPYLGVSEFYFHLIWILFTDHRHFPTLPSWCTVWKVNKHHIPSKCFVSPEDLAVLSN